MRDDLSGLRVELSAHVVGLRLRVVAGVPESRGAALAQAFEDRTRMDDLGDTLATVHQKLLSLYPAVDERVVEEARQLAGEARRRTTADDPDAALAAFAARVSDLRDVLGEVVRTGA